EDLCKFGSWAAQQCSDPNFLKLVEEYGKEFYPSKGEIRHDGVIPSSSANLSSFIEHGVTIAIVSDRNPGAMQMDEAIRTHMLHK
ncbi:MAG: hypothetical protein EBZ47_09855, partial [Chlamydiae bacterium]|nr:hypothetical protein [Chlamydiota bacterium]